MQILPLVVLQKLVEVLLLCSKDGVIMMAEGEKDIEFKKAAIIFVTAALIIFAAGIGIGEALIWDRYDTSDPAARDIKYLEQVLKQDPESDQLLVELGWLYYRTGDYQKANQALTRAVSVNKLNPAAHFNLGLVYRETGLLEKAVQEFQRTLELDPDSRYAYFELGKVYFSQEKWDQAAGQFRYAAEKDPAGADNYYWLGQAFERMGKNEEARAAYLRVLEMVPDHPEAAKADQRLRM